MAKFARGIEYLSEMRGRDYPFVNDPSADIPELADLFSDMLITCPHAADDDSTFVLESLEFEVGGIARVRLYREFTGPTPEVLLFDTSDDDVTSTSSVFGQYIVYSWFHEATETHLQITANYDQLTNTGDAVYFGKAIEINSSCIELTPTRVDGFLVTAGVSATEYALKGDVIFDAGCNIRYTVDAPEPDDPRPYTRITIDAIPGEGTGRCPVECDAETQEPVLKTVNGAGPDTYGNLNINGDGCVWLQNVPRQYTGSIPAFDPYISFNHDCAPCLDCADIESGYLNLQSIHTVASAVRNRLCQSLVVYDDFFNLSESFRTYIEQPWFSFRFEKVAGYTYNVWVRFFSGGVAVSGGGVSAVNRIQFTVDYPGQQSYVGYSGITKMPGLGMQRFDKDWADLGREFDSDVSGFANPPMPFNNGGLFPAYAYGYWRWQVTLEAGYPPPFDITFDATATYTDGSTYSRTQAIAVGNELGTDTG